VLLWAYYGRVGQVKSVEPRPSDFSCSSGLALAKAGRLLQKGESMTANCLATLNYSSEVARQTAMSFLIDLYMSYDLYRLVSISFISLSFYQIRYEPTNRI
jgi:hypothetical protein